MLQIELKKVNQIYGNAKQYTRIKMLIKASPLMQKETRGQMMVQRHITVQIGQRVQAKPGIRRLNREMCSATSLAAPEK